MVENWNRQSPLTILMCLRNRFLSWKKKKKGSKRKKIPSPKIDFQPFSFYIYLHKYSWKLITSKNKLKASIIFFFFWNALKAPIKIPLFTHYLSNNNKIIQQMSKPIFPFLFLFFLNIPTLNYYSIIDI